MRRTPISRVGKTKPLGKPAGESATYDNRRFWTREQWREHLDDLARAIVMTTSGVSRMPTARGFGWFGPCAWCRERRWLSACHIEPKGTYRSVRWDLDNLFAGCYRCHIHRWHKDPEAAREFRLRLLGEPRSIALYVRARASGAREPDFEATRFALVLRLREIAPGGVPGLYYA